MTHWVIGDVQGCDDALARLLEAVAFDAARDRVWFCGDLVNRGGESLQVLRRVHALGDAADSVLGNHDLHLLAVAAGHGRDRHRENNPEFDAIFSAADGPELLRWLQARPMALHDSARDVLLVHAGVLPQWSVSDTLACAGELETALRGKQARRYFEGMYGNQPDRWSTELAGMDRLRLITNALTRLRYCSAEGRILPKDKGAPGTQARGALPWFEAPRRHPLDARVVFGHWSTLGLHRGPGVLAIDTGCVWGGPLTAVDLDNVERVVQVPGQKRRR